MVKKALFVIDMINDFVEEDGALPVPRAKKILPKINFLIKEFIENGDIIYQICDSHLPNDKEFENWPPHAVEGTQGSLICSNLSPINKTRIIKKTRYSGFFNTKLENFLIKDKINEIFIVGVVTNICILMTAVDAKQRDYKVNVIKECVASLPDETGKFDDNEYFFERQAPLLGINVID